MLGFALYILTALLTAVPVLYALGWAVWGAPVSVTEYFSLIGSLVLAASAVVSLRSRRRRLAARCALLGSVLVWSFYLPAIVGAARMKLTDQRLEVMVFRWTPSSEPLTVLASGIRVIPADIDQMIQAGITGNVEAFSNGTYGNRGKRGQAIIVIQRPVTAAVELPQPDATTIVYVQTTNGWQMYPDQAPRLKRMIRIQPDNDDPEQSLLQVELSTGARQGFDIWWPKKR